MKDFCNFFIFDFIRFGRKKYPYLFTLSIICVIFDYYMLFNNTYNKFTIIGATCLSIYFIVVYIAYLDKRYNDLKL